MSSNTEKVKEVIDYLNTEMEKLAIFKYDLEKALSWTFKAFEDSVRLYGLGRKRDPGITEMIFRDGIDGLNILLPQIYKRCKPGNSITFKYEDDAYEDSTRALQFFISYYSIVNDANNLARDGVYNIEKHKDTYRFLPTLNAMNYDAAGQVVTMINKESDLEKIKNKPIKQIDVESFAKNIHLKTNSTFSYSVPKEVEEAIDLINNNVLETHSFLQDNIKLGKYNVKEAKQIYKTISKLAIIHNFTCLFSGSEGIGIDMLPLTVRRADLSKFVRKNCGVGIDKVKAFIADILYNDTTTEVMVQPLIPIKNGEVLFISPQIFMFSSVERNLMKLWANKYRTVYSTDIAKLGKEAEIDLANILRKNHKDFRVVNSRKITDKGGSVLTDIDVAVYDKKSQDLLVIQMKWFNHPDSSKEVKTADVQLNDAIEQLRKSIYYFQSSPESLKAVFGLDGYSIKKIFSCVVSKNHIGSFWISDNSVKILNLDISERLISKYKNKSVAALYNLLISRQEYKQYIHYLSAFKEYKIGNYFFRLPATILLDKANIFVRLFRSIKYYLFNRLTKNRFFFWKVIRVNPLFK